MKWALSHLMKRLRSSGSYNHQSVNYYKGSTTIELALMIPVVLLVIVVVIQSAFYYHDKNVIYGKVYELGAIVQQQERLVSGIDTQELEAHYKEGVDNKLILFSEITCSVKETTGGIKVNVTTEKGLMALKIEREFGLYYPEQNVRSRKN